MQIFDSCKSCKRLGTSRLHELHESNLPFVSRIEFIRSKLSNFSAHVSGVTGLTLRRRRRCDLCSDETKLDNTAEIADGGRFTVVFTRMATVRTEMQATSTVKSPRRH